MPHAKGGGLHAGDLVYAKWPGSCTWFPAKIVGSSSTNISVEFDDGTVHDLSSQHIAVSSC